MFSKLEAYANKHGCETNKPYFALNGQRVTSEQWACMRGKFRGRTGLTNVWKIPPVSGPERLKEKGKSSHMNQKPEVIFRELIEATSDKNDVIWEPFGGTCTAAVAAYALGRSSHSCEINSVYHRIAQQRLTSNMT